MVARTTGNIFILIIKNIRFINIESKSSYLIIIYISNSDLFKENIGTISHENE